MNKLLAGISFIAFSALATSAMANNQGQVWPKWYVGLSAGLTYLDDADVSGTTTGELGFDTGAAVTGSIGYVLPWGTHPLGNMRVEFEAGYREASLDNVTVGGVSTASPGRSRIASYMANAFYDFRSTSRFTPYVGGGVGVAQVGIGHDSGLGNTNDDEDTVFAYQAMVGLSYAPAAMPNTEWSLGYRYFGADSPEYTAGAGKVKLDDLMIHSAEIGARFKF